MSVQKDNGKHAKSSLLLAKFHNHAIYNFLHNNCTSSSKVNGETLCH